MTIKYMRPSEFIGDYYVRYSKVQRGYVLENQKQVIVVGGAYSARSAYRIAMGLEHNPKATVMILK